MPSLPNSSFEKKRDIYPFKNTMECTINTMEECKRKVSHKKNLRYCKSMGIFLGLLFLTIVSMGVLTFSIYKYVTLVQDIQETQATPLESKLETLICDTSHYPCYEVWVRFSYSVDNQLYYGEHRENNRKLLVEQLYQAYQSNHTFTIYYKVSKPSEYAMYYDDSNGYLCFLIFSSIYYVWSSMGTFLYVSAKCTAKCIDESDNSDSDSDTSNTPTIHVNENIEEGKTTM